VAQISTLDIRLLSIATTLAAPRFLSCCTKRGQGEGKAPLGASGGRKVLLGASGGRKVLLAASGQRGDPVGRADYGADGDVVWFGGQAVDQFIVVEQGDERDQRPDPG
jgi:hypothetical protein